MNGQQYLFCSKVFQSIFVNYTREWMIEWMNEGENETTMLIIISLNSDWWSYDPET